MSAGSKTNLLATTAMVRGSGSWAPASTLRTSVITASTGRQEADLDAMKPPSEQAQCPGVNLGAPLQIGPKSQQTRASHLPVRKSRTKTEMLKMGSEVICW